MATIEWSFYIREHIGTRLVADFVANHEDGKNVTVATAELKFDPASETIIVTSFKQVYSGDAGVWAKKIREEEVFGRKA